MKSQFNPLVSIIIPIYNGSNFMCEAIDSALAQTYENIEIIVVNDGSIDNTEEIAKSYGDKIRYFTKENGGVATALNLAIKKSKGKYISWLSHDDMYYPEKIEKQITKLLELDGEKCFNTILYSNFSMINEKSKMTSTTSFHEGHDIKKLNHSIYPILKGIIHGCTLLIPKKCFEDVAYFDEELKTTQDYDLWFKMFPKYDILFMNDILIRSRLHDDQGSKKIQIGPKETNELWIKMIQRLSDDQKIEIDGTVLNFYENTKKIVLDAKYLDAVQYIEQKIEKYKSRDITQIKISVIIPFYNRIDWTAEAIMSVLNQTHVNLEVILINDFSIDNIQKIKKIVESDKRIKLYDNVNKKGVSGSRNTGIDFATGEYIAFLDSDDLFLSTKIEKQLNFMVREGVFFSHTSYILFCDKSQKAQLMNSGVKDYIFPDIISGCAIATPTVMIHASLFKSNKIRFPEGVFGGEDTCLWIDVARTVQCFGFSEALSKVRDHGNNFAYDDMKQIQGMINVLRYVSTKYLSIDTSNYLSSLTAKIKLQLEDLHIDDNDFLSSINNDKKIKSNVKIQSDEISVNTHEKKSFKENLREALRKIVWTISPNFRMQIGNKKRLNQLLSKIDNLENSLDTKIDNLENSLDTKIDNLEESSNNSILLLKDSINWLKKDYAINRINADINLLEDIIYIPKEHKSQKIFYKCDVVKFFEKMKSFIIKSDIVLDIGPGIRPQTFFTPKVHICIEPFKQYRDIVRPLFPNQSHAIFLREGGIEGMKILDDNSVDSVFMIDLIEHLDKNDGLKLLKEADRVARKQIVVFTPLGFYPMHFREDGQKDAWGLDGTDVQEHKSGWLPKDFGGDWDFHICIDCHEAFLPAEKKQGKKYSALMAIKTKKFDGFLVQKETPDFIKEVYNQRIIEDNLIE